MENRMTRWKSKEISIDDIVNAADKIQRNFENKFVISLVCKLADFYIYLN
jgi:hypothetical protein